MAELNAVTTTGAILGAVLVKLRTEKGINQGDFANVIGISASTWSRIEKGESGLSIEQLRSAAKVFGVTAGFILEIAEAAEKELENSGVHISSTWPSMPKGLDSAVVMGAAIGTVIPIVGTALGAIIGGAIGHFINKVEPDKK